MYVSLPQLAKHIGYGTATVRRHVRELHAAGSPIVIRVGQRGQYRIDRDAFIDAVASTKPLPRSETREEAIRRLTA